MMEVCSSRSYVGRTELQHDFADRHRFAKLAALLDRETSTPRTTSMPPLGHWLCFLPHERQSLIGPDGHPARSDQSILPVFDLPRRMWAGSRICFVGDVALDQPITRRSTLITVAPKQGRSGRMLFATLRHEIGGEEGDVAIIEEQDIVYREASISKGGYVRQGGDETGIGPEVGEFSPDAVMLFRYSALTFNGHRIHYDREYARDCEGYPDLVAHGPLVATMMLEQLLLRAPDIRIRTFRFRAICPFFEGDKVRLHLDLEGQGARLAAVGPMGVGMSGEATF